MSTPEQLVTSAILQRVGALPHIRLWRQQAGMAFVSTGPASRALLLGLVKRGLARPIDLAPAGASDYVGILAPSGRHVALEIKSAAGRLSEDQAGFGRMIQSRGGLWIVARSADEAERGLAT